MARSLDIVSSSWWFTHPLSTESARLLTTLRRRGRYRCRCDDNGGDRRSAGLHEEEEEIIAVGGRGATWGEKTVADSRKKHLGILYFFHLFLFFSRSWIKKINKSKVTKAHYLKKLWRNYKYGYKYEFNKINKFI